MPEILISQTVSEELYRTFLKTLQTFQDPAVLAKSPLLERPLIQQMLQDKNGAIPYQTLKNIFGEILELLARENPHYADLLRGRFWEGKQIEEMLTLERPLPMSKRTFSNYQRSAIQMFAFLFLEAEARNLPKSAFSLTLPTIAEKPLAPRLSSSLPAQPHKPIAPYRWIFAHANFFAGIVFALLVLGMASVVISRNLQSVTAQNPATPHPLVYTYTTMEGAKLQLYPYEGVHIALLTPQEYNDPAVLGRIVDAVDRAYAYYVEATGREPNLASTYHGRTTIAVVPSACGGSGCGYFGATGVEIQTQSFEELFYGVKERNQFEQLVFFELGNNFWFYEDKLGYVGADNVADIGGGYAVFMRFMAMEAAGVAGGPFGGIDFTMFKTQIRGILARYLSDPTLTWANTLKIGYSPTGSSADLFASYLFELRAQYGDAFVLRLWKEVEQQPDRQTTQDAVHNFISAASRAAQVDLTTRFATTWRWSVAPVAPALNNSAISKRSNGSQATIDQAPATLSNH